MAFDAESDVLADDFVVLLIASIQLRRIPDVIAANLYVELDVCNCDVTLECYQYAYIYDNVDMNHIY